MKNTDSTNTTATL